MPAKLFGFDFGGQRLSPTLEPAHGLKHNSVTTVTETRRSSMDFKRPNLGLTSRKHSSKERNSDRSLSKDKNAKEIGRSPLQAKPVTLGMIMESPPALMIDAPSQSSGALISGRLQVNPNASEDRCRECATQVKDLYEWTFLTKPKLFTVAQGMQELPFSHLIPGHLPATTHGQIGSIDYSLHVRARATDGQEIEFRRELVISRALRPGNDKNSVRIFPPTNMTLHVTLPNVVHPIGEFPVLCRMTGILTKHDDTQTRWRLRKLNWRIEERETAVSPACPQHAGKVGGPGKGVQHEHARDVGGAELKSGWKTDLSAATPDGCVEGEFLVAMDGSASCAVDAPHGTRLEHHLVLELVIAEEWASNRRPDHATPTGAARVLRTQFKLAVTERAGMGIAWDDEQPPMYDDVPASPPHYVLGTTSVEAYEGEDLHEDVEQLTLGP